MRDTLAKDLEDQLLGHLWNAGLADDWQPFLEALSKGLHSRCAALADHDHARGAGCIRAAIGVDPDWQATYDAHYSRVNVWLPGQADLPAGSVVIGEQLLPVSELKRSEYYADWLRPQGLLHALGCTALRHKNEISGLGLLREKEAGAFDAEEVRLLQRLMPHLASAMQVAHRLQSLKAERFQTDQGFELHPVGMMLVNQQLSVGRHNAAAARILDQHDGLSIDLGGCLRVWNPAADQALGAWMAELGSQGLRALAGRRVQVPRPSGRPAYVLQPAPMPGSTEVWQRDLRRGARLLLMVIDPARGMGGDEARALGLLKWQFGLSRSEARLAWRLVEGLSLAEAAAALGITLGNARTTSKQLLRKCAVSRQSELVRLLLNSLIC